MGREVLRNVGNCCRSVNGGIQGFVASKDLVKITLLRCVRNNRANKMCSREIEVIIRVIQGRHGFIRLHLSCLIFEDLYYLRREHEELVRDETNSGPTGS
jgi:hypothetical protein